MNTYAKIIVRQDFTKKDGTNPICLRITINRKAKYFSLNVSVKPGFWDEKNSKVKKSHPNSYNINLIIDSSINRANQIIFDYSLKNKLLSNGEFSRMFCKPVIKNNSFFEFANQELEALKTKFSASTIKTYKSHLAKLRSFSSELSFEEISISFIKAYEIHMISLGNQDNTRFKSMAIIKSFINRAIKEEHIKENPFKFYPIGNKQGSREFLTMTEINSLESRLDSDMPQRLKNVLRYFLFSCYTGLRYQDIHDLKHSDLENNMVKIVMHKTKDSIKIPLTQRAKNLLEEGFASQKVFKVNTNQVTNRFLKEIALNVGIKKEISFHCARHTFATNCISLGIPLEVVSKLLGHKDLGTTQIYAKIMDNVKVEQMEKWDL